MYLISYFEQDVVTDPLTAQWVSRARVMNPNPVYNPQVRMVDHSKHDVWSLGCLV